MKKSLLEKLENKVYVLPIIVVIIIASLVFDGYSIYFLQKENLNLQSDIGQYEKATAALQKNLSFYRSQNSQIQNALRNEQTNNEVFQTQIGNLSGTVSTLQKLTQTDPELLKKYSKIYFLNENYVPKSLLPIDTQYTYNKNKPEQFLASVYPHLQQLLTDANSQGVNLLILSAYRTYGEQAALKSSYKVVYGSGANTFSADQGYSEHQLGTTVDFTTQSIGAVLSGFDKTPAYQWILNNAYKYGFVISYPKANSYYIFEPWHWRFVGVDLATWLHTNNLYFYALDQRVIDTYLIKFFD